LQGTDALPDMEARPVTEAVTEMLPVTPVRMLKVAEATPFVVVAEVVVGDALLVKVTLVGSTMEPPPALSVTVAVAVQLAPGVTMTLTIDVAGAASAPGVNVRPLPRKAAKARTVARPNATETLDKLRLIDPSISYRYRSADDCMALSDSAQPLRCFDSSP
jgi:hypothetical protein